MTMPRQKEAFLTAFRASGNVKRSLNTIKEHRSTLRKWLKEDEDFRKNFMEIERDWFEERLDDADDECFRRAVTGVPEPVVYKGMIVYELDENGEYLLDDNFEKIPVTVRKTSDTALGLYLKCNHPRYKGEDASGEVKAEINVNFIPRPDPVDTE